MNDAPNRTRPRALVVEDEPLVQTVLLRICKWSGVDAISADDGQQGIAMLDEESFDLVITDLRMPGASGIDVARRAFALERPPAVIVVSGYTTPEEESTIAETGATFLPKPFDARTARTVIEQVLAGRR